METLGVFLLVIVAFIGTALVVVDPFGSLFKLYTGKKRNEARADIDAMMAEKAEGDLLSRGCKFLLLLNVYLFYSFFVAPLAAVYALVKNVGHRLIALAVLAIIVFSALSFARNVFKDIFKTQGEEAEKNGSEQEVKVYPLRRFFFRVLYALPIFYLWYLFLVIVGILP